MKPRPLFSLNSVRMRLTLWNVAVLALALAGLGIVFIVSFQATIGVAVNQRLSQRAHRDQWLFAHSPSFPLPPARHFSRPPSSGEANSFGELRSRFFDPHGKSVDGLGRPDLIPQSPWEEAGLARALRGEEVYATVQANGQEVRVLSFPLLRGGRLYGAAQVGNSLARIAEDRARMVRTLLTLIPLVLLIAGVGGAFLTDRALRPVRQIAHAAGRIETENLSRRLPVVGHDEFADLADTFNGMLQRLQRGFERQEQAFEQQRRFTADASHELRTPLTIIKANTSLALTGRRTEEEYQRTLRAVDTAADRMNRLVQDLLMLARSDAGQLSYSLHPTALSDILRQAIALLPETERAMVTLDLPSPVPWVQGDADSLVRLFGNLLENAAHYTPADGCITISAKSQESSVVIEVADTGEGIALEHLPYVTERFYRVEAARSRIQGGTGLGLSICRSIVEGHRGELTLESVVGLGTRVRVTLACADEMASLLAYAETETACF